MMRFLLPLASAAVLASAGVGLVRITHGHNGLVAELLRTAARLHLDPDNRLVHAALVDLAGLGRTRLELLAAGAFVYAVLHVVEGTGLLLGRRWAEWFTVLMTSSLLPLELFEIARGPDLLRLGIFAANLAILLYLLRQLGAPSRPEAP